MNIQQTRAFLLWCTIIDVAILLLWFLLFTFAHDGLYQLSWRVVPLAMEHFDMLHYAGIALFKIGTILFNIVPLIALSLVR